MRRWVKRLGVVLVPLAVVAAITGSRGTYEEFSRSSEQAPRQPPGAPSWTRTCDLGAGRHWLHCVRVSGRVAWIQRHDPDGDGDVHLLVVSRLRVRVVKLGVTTHLPVPGIGTRVTATGPLRRGASVKQEIAAVTLYR